MIAGIAGFLTIILLLAMLGIADTEIEKADRSEDR